MPWEQFCGRPPAIISALAACVDLTVTDQLAALLAGYAVIWQLFFQDKPPAHREALPSGGGGQVG